MNKIMIVDVIRFALGVILGLIAISLTAELIEFGLVTLINDGVTMEQEVFFNIRNQSWFLFLKFFYNGFALLGGGWFATRIASRWKFACGVTLVSVQTISFVWGMMFSEFAGTTPTWAWILLVIEFPIVILWGAKKFYR